MWSGFKAIFIGMIMALITVAMLITIYLIYALTLRKSKWRLGSIASRIEAEQNPATEYEADTVISNDKTVAVLFKTRPVKQGASVNRPWKGTLRRVYTIVDDVLDTDRACPDCIEI